LPGEILHASQHSGKMRKRQGNRRGLNGIPNPTAQHGGDRKVIFDLGRLPGKSASRLAERYLTTE
jgi:hypothetical protein